MADNAIQIFGRLPQSSSVLVRSNAGSGRSTRSENANTTVSGPSGDSVTISPEARRMAQGLGVAAEDEKSNEADNPATEKLSDAERREVQQLRRRDGEVRRHEAAHVAAGGQYVRSGAQLEYTTGPDGRRYATGGEVSIDVGSARTPQATIQKANVVRRAALAPADPSPQDRRVAAQASQMETRARRELAEQRPGDSGGTAVPLSSAPPDADSDSAPQVSGERRVSNEAKPISSVQEGSAS